MKDLAIPKSKSQKRKIKKQFGISKIRKSSLRIKKNKSFQSGWRMKKLNKEFSNIQKFDNSKP